VLHTILYYTLCYILYYTLCYILYYTLCYILYYTLCYILYYTLCYILYYTLHYILYTVLHTIYCVTYYTRVQHIYATKPKAKISYSFKLTQLENNYNNTSFKRETVGLRSCYHKSRVEEICSCESGYEETACRATLEIVCVSCNENVWEWAGCRSGCVRRD